jgi:lipoprotein NlpI
VKAGETELCDLTVGDDTYRIKLATVHLPWPMERWMDVDGVIGWPDMKEGLLAIDAGDDAIKAIAALPQDTNGWVKLPLYRRTDVLALEIPRADRKIGVLQVDTGNAGGISLSPARWKAWRAAHPHAHGHWQFSFMPGSGISIGRTYDAPEIAIGPLTWTNVNIGKANRTETSIAGGKDVHEASIGVAALHQLNLIIDGTNNAAYVRTNPDVGSQGQAKSQTRACGMITSTNSTVRLGFREHEYRDLAIEAYESGKFEVVVTNASRLLELRPNEAEAFALRGIALSRLCAAEGNATDMDRVLGDLSRALELEPDMTSAYGARGNTYYLTQRWGEALKDYQRFCEQAPEEANYQQFFIWLIRTRNGGQAVADRELAAWFGPGRKLKANRWERTIAKFLLDRMSEAEFLRAAGYGAARDQAGLQCEAWFYAGMKRLVAGDAATARKYLQKSVASGQKDYDEYNFAASELRILAQREHAAAR